MRASQRRPAEVQLLQKLLLLEAGNPGVGGKCRLVVLWGAASGVWWGDRGVSSRDSISERTRGRCSGFVTAVYLCGSGANRGSVPFWVESPKSQSPYVMLTTVCAASLCSVYLEPHPQSFPVPRCPYECFL